MSIETVNEFIKTMETFGYEFCGYTDDAGRQIEDDVSSVEQCVAKFSLPSSAPTDVLDIPNDVYVTVKPNLDGKDIFSSWGYSEATEDPVFLAITHMFAYS